MHIFKRKATSKGFSTSGTKVLGGGIRLNRTMRMPTKGKGMTEKFYEQAKILEDPYKAYSPEFVKKFESVRIKNSRPKSYITF